MSNKYLNFINGKFIYTEQKSVNDAELHQTLPVSQFSKIITVDKNVVKITTLDKKIYYVFYLDIRSSGKLENDNKRVQIPSNFSLKNNIISIFVYLSGERNCYARIDNNIITNSSDTSKSIWIYFNHIVYCLKNNEKIKFSKTLKETKEKYFIYLSTNFLDLLDFNEQQYNEVDFNKFELINSEIKNYKNISKNNEKFISIQRTNNDFDFSHFVESPRIINNCEESKENYTMINLIKIGRKAEEIFMNKLLNDPIEIAKKLNIKEIYSKEWLNEEKESYQPYDFCINDHIYIDVKGTSRSTPYFVISENEQNFRQETIEKGNKYFVVNIYNLLLNEDNTYNMKIFDDKKIEESYDSQKVEYIYKGEKNNE